MKIVTIPHEALRKEAEPITTVDKKLLNFVREIEKTLAHKKNPQGVGLAAPQVNKNWALFTTLLEDEHGKTKSRIFINPKITDASDSLILGPSVDDAVLEGCLSMPEIYAPVPRHTWTTFSFHTIEGDELVEQEEVFTDFTSRVMQHELDHLHGILFTDYALKQGLPIYKENKKTKKMVEIDPALLEFI